MMLDQLKSRLPGDWNFTAGDNIEYGEPERLVPSDKNDFDCLIVNNKNMTVRAEIQYKPGNSWYFSHGSNIGLLCFVGKIVENGWSDWQFRYLDKGINQDKCLNWLYDVIEIAECKNYKNVATKRVTTCSQKYIDGNGLDHLKRLQSKVVKSCKYAIEQTIAKSSFLNSDLMKKHGIEVKIKRPNTFYVIPNSSGKPDGIGGERPYTNYSIVEICLPYPSLHEQMSMVIQCRQDGKLFYTIRALTRDEKPELIRIDEEEEIKREDIIDVMDRWVRVVEDLNNN